MRSAKAEISLRINWVHLDSQVADNEDTDWSARMRDMSEGTFPNTVVADVF